MLRRNFWQLLTLSLRTMKIRTMKNLVVPEGYQVRWEYADKSKGKQGWFKMYDRIAKQLEKLLTDNADAEKDSKLRLRDEDNVVWKFCLREMTQRRLIDGNDECKRRIRRIFVCDDWESKRI